MCSETDCDATFRGDYRKGNLARHLRRIHRGIPGEYLCEKSGCFKSFNRSDARLKHYRKCHGHPAPTPAEPRPRQRNNRRDIR
jgi:uncharacterized Zn-finger protein